MSLRKPGMIATRRYPRFSMQCDVLYQADGGVKKAAISNLSLGGCYLSTTRPLPVGSRFPLLLMINTDPPLHLVGAVRWASERGMGVEFRPPLGRQREVLKLVLETSRADVSVAV